MDKDNRQLMEGTEEFEIVLGTYENFVIGYSFRRLQDNLFSLIQSFASPSHRASVRAIASSGKFMASGSSDETIQLFNMNTRKEMGSLVQHDGTINALKFYGHSHLFSASDDGTICAWDTGSWQCLKTLKGHKQPVNDLAVHPSGKLLLSVSRDKTLYTWNLVKGRPAFITNIKVEASHVEWCPTEGPGDFFVVIHANVCDVYSTAVGGVVGNVDFGRKISDLTFIGELLVLSGEEGKVSIFDLSVRDDVGKVAPSCVVDFDADDSGKRIKCVAYGGPSQRMGCHHLVTGSSEGVVTVWLVNVAGGDVKKSDKVQKLARAAAGCRLTACDVSIKVDDNDITSQGRLSQGKPLKQKPRTTGVKRKAVGRDEGKDVESKPVRQKLMKATEVNAKAEGSKRKFALIKKKIKKSVSF